jgi:dihydroorotate dehydrogenase
VIYRLFFRLVLSHIDAERMHAVASRVLRTVNGISVLRTLLRKRLFPSDRRLRVRALGLDFPSPLGLAAGFDKDATTFDAYATLGFGCVEVGTVTSRCQAGLPKRRIYRISRERAVINWMGFPNEGADAIAERLHRRTDRRAVIGVNVGKSREVGLDDASRDFQETVSRLAPLADYLVLNVSSPNTPDLRDMQSPERLSELVTTVRSGMEGLRPVPLLIKISPDLSDPEIDAIADLAMELKLDGIVAINTTTNMEVLQRPLEQYGVPARGGISGAPVQIRAREVLRRLYARTGGRLTLVSVGGIDGAEEAWERVKSGATLLQAHTGFVYGGPLWPSRVNRKLARLAAQAGFTNVQDAVGTEATPVDAVANRNGARPSSDAPAVDSTQPHSTSAFPSIA